jgi:hypothetical protein
LEIRGLPALELLVLQDKLEPKDLLEFQEVLQVILGPLELREIPELLELLV